MSWAESLVGAAKRTGASLHCSVRRCLTYGVTAEHAEQHHDAGKHDCEFDLLIRYNERMTSLTQMKTDVAEFAKLIGVNEVTPTWSGCDGIWPVLEYMREKGAIVVIKLDGERERRPYTVIMTWPHFDSHFRGDFERVEEGICLAILEFASRLNESSGTA